MKMSSVYAREIYLKNRTRMNKRHIILEIIIIALLIPALLLLSLKLGDRQYYISTVAVMILTMLPFFLHFEYRMPTARELVTLSVMAALCAAGRIAFVMVPNFSAMTGMIMICGIALGPEAGFIIGSVAAFVSNFISYKWDIKCKIRIHPKEVIFIRFQSFLGFFNKCPLVIGFSIPYLTIIIKETLNLD